VERAGGAATDGRGRVLERIPRSLHDRTPLVIGSKGLVDELTALMREDDPWPA
jgi:fructose-1,6-bisphosphatase I